jgi:hypothetical protein
MEHTYLVSATCAAPDASRRRMRMTGHRTDSVERRQNIVDVEDVRTAKRFARSDLKLTPCARNLLANVTQARQSDE